MDTIREWAEKTVREQRILEDINKMFEESDSAELEERHFTKPQPIACKWCGSLDIMRYGKRNGVQEYICLKCHRKFNEKDAPYRMRSSVEQIGAALNMFYDGLSFADISRHLAETYNNPVSKSTVYRWVVKYTTIAIDQMDKFTPETGGWWVVDETVLRIGDNKWWFWDIICADTRYLLASHLSRTRGMLDVVTVMRRAWQRAGTAPKIIVSDGLPAYPDGIERVFGAYSRHIQSRGFTDEINTNLIERWHGTLKERTKVLRGFKSLESATLILDGFLMNYNYFRPHQTLQNRTPAEVAGIKTPYKNWTELVRKVGM